MTTATSLYPAVAAEVAAEQTPLRPRDQDQSQVSQFGNVGAVPVAHKQAEQTVRRVTMADFEPQGYAREALTGIKQRG